MKKLIKVKLICSYCRSDDVYRSNLNKGYKYRCNCCGEYLK